MRHRLTGITWLVTCTVVLAHCGGDGSNVVLDGGHHSGSGSNVEPSDDASVSSGDDATMPGSGGGSSSNSGSPSGADGSATLVDGSIAETGTGPSSVPVPAGGAASDPGSITCNGAPCDVSTGNYCCVELGGDGGVKETCKGPNSACNGLTLKCDEASDCQDGAVCCQIILGIALLGPTSCQTRCAGLPVDFQTCRTDAECGVDSDAAATKRCIPQVCTDTASKRTVSIEACAGSAAIVGPGYPAYLGPVGPSTAPGPLPTCAASQ